MRHSQKNIKCIFLVKIYLNYNNTISFVQYCIKIYHLSVGDSTLLHSGRERLKGI